MKIEVNLSKIIDKYKIFQCEYMDENLRCMSVAEYYLTINNFNIRICDRHRQETKLRVKP